MTCDAERVTGYVDGALDETQRAEVDAHLAECAVCRDQAEAERLLGERLRELPAPGLPAATAARVRRRIPRRRSPIRYLVPLAAALVLGVWARGMAPIVSWELARDHDACYSHKELPAQIWSQSPREIDAWFEAAGTRMPLVPESVAGLHLVGARFCPLPGLTRAPHLYYLSEESQLSLFVVPRSVRFESPYATRSRGHPVRLLRVANTVVGLVGNSDREVDDFVQSFTHTMARLGVPTQPIS